MTVHCENLSEDFFFLLKQIDFISNIFFTKKESPTEKTHEFNLTILLDLSYTMLCVK